MNKTIGTLVDELIRDFLKDEERSSADPIYTISVVAERLAVHPNTLRNYERHGLLRPTRAGNARRYSDADVLRAGLIRRLTEDFGVDMVGARVVVVLLTTLRTERVETGARPQRVFLTARATGNDRGPQQTSRRPRRPAFSG